MNSKMMKSDIEKQQVKENALDKTSFESSSKENSLFRWKQNLEKEDSQAGS